MKVNEMLVVLGGKDLILRRAEELPEDVIQVKDPLIFLSRIELLSLSSAPAVNGTHPAPAPKKRKKRPLPHRSKVEVKLHQEVLHSRGKLGARLGYYRITPEDLDLIKLAVETKDNALSNFQLSALRMRFGLEGSPAMRLDQIAYHLAPGRPDKVSREIKRAIRLLGIKKVPYPKTRKYRGQ